MRGSTTRSIVNRCALAFVVLLASAVYLSVQSNSHFRPNDKAYHAPPPVVAYRRYKGPIHPSTHVSRPFWSKLFPGRPT
jgi:hypothetical protein